MNGGMLCSTTWVTTSMCSSIHTNKNPAKFAFVLHPRSHASHHILAVYTLGASKELIEAIYPHHTWYQRPLMPSPEAIMEQNFTVHLGEPK